MHDCQGAMHGCRGGACVVAGGMCGCGGCMVVGGVWLGGMHGCRGACVVVEGHVWWQGGHAWDTTRYGQSAGSMHPTGMHSCFKYNCAILFSSQLYWLFIYASKYIFPYKIHIDAYTKI